MDIQRVAWHILFMWLFSEDTVSSVCLFLAQRQSFCHSIRWKQGYLHVDLRGGQREKPKKTKHNKNSATWLSRAVSRVIGEGKSPLLYLRAHHARHIQQRQCRVGENSPIPLLPHSPNDIGARCFSLGSVAMYSSHHPLKSRFGVAVVDGTARSLDLVYFLIINFTRFYSLEASGGSNADLLYAFSSVPRDINFIDHSSDLGWKEHERFEKLIVDSSLYMDKNTEPFPATETRKMPEAFKIFTGSPWVILSRNFTEHCVHGWDNLPRRLLMYFANAAYSMESYFQTVICSSSDFRNTTVNGDLRYFVWDDPPGLEPLILDESHFDNMANSSAAFARRFVEDALVLKKVDDELLNRSVWCLDSGEKQGSRDVESCSKWGDVNVVRPGRAGEKLRHFIYEISQRRGCTDAVS